MINQPSYLVDQFSTKVAVLDIAPVGAHYRGTIGLEAMPPDLKRLFEEFEANVEGQMFTLADEIENKIGVIPLKVVFPNGMEAYVEDLHVYPSTKKVSFKVRHMSRVVSPSP